ncbi:protein of unknown function DUF354 [Candidatus Koribacter versatilis Ellin345]|uniref:DUF354 domain-containing protein n=1 Tax=Koribacter versatilis (strain Ellin345) TaxID=204669 RepID=Q1INF9_KORVE|nr:DUF354 domain-containing protein [Candidatus Koribacter versatilis]ABF41591.1 protein of unknown function DUF354 [Candidatus Koribacter versatilis Ellin345]
MQPRIWIDLDNAPHAHFFAPFVRELPKHGYMPLITVRSFGQTEGLARSYRMNFTTIGAHAPHHSTVARVREAVGRAAELVRFGIAHRPVAAISHGSRSLTLAAATLGIPAMAIYDYEHVSAGVFHHLCRRILMPEIVANAGQSKKKIRGYPGFKEDVYIHDLRPDGRVLHELSLDPQRLIVTVRPPATWAHYHNEHSVVLFRALIEHLRAQENAQVVVLARTRDQAEKLSGEFNLGERPFILTSRAVDGLSLLHYSDAVFSGGGTMVREAALLGVAAYSTFAGKPGAVDIELERQKRLTILRTQEQVAGIRLRKRPRRIADPRESPTRRFILKEILELARH